MSLSSLFAQAPSDRRPTLGAVLLAFGLTCLIFLIYQLGGASFKMMVTELNLGIPVAWVLAISQLVFLFVPALFLLKSVGLTFFDVYSARVIQINKEVNQFPPVPVARVPRVTPQHFVLGILTVFAIQVFSAAIVPLQYEVLPNELAEQLRDLGSKTQEYYLEIFGEANAANYIRSIIVAALVPALAEETLFRAYLQRFLAQRYTAFSAIVLTSVLFSLLHFNPDALLPLFFVGLLFGLAAWHTGGLILPIFLHLFNNALAVSVYFAMPDLTETSGGEGSWFVALLALISILMLFVAFVRLTPGVGRPATDRDTSGSV